MEKVIFISFNERNGHYRIFFLKALRFAINGMDVNKTNKNSSSVE